MNIHLFLNEILCKREIIPKTGSVQKTRFYVPHILIVKGTKMTKADMERYYFYRLYVIDFDAAKHTFEVLRRYKRNDIRFYLLRDLVMCYSRPFSGNKGENYSKHSMPESFVPKHLRPLHKELLTVRNQLFAHHDYTYRKPKVANWSTTTRKIFPMSFRGYDCGKLDAQLAEIKELVNLVAENLQREIDNIEKNL